MVCGFGAQVYVQLGECWECCGSMRLCCCRAPIAWRGCWLVLLQGVLLPGQLEKLHDCCFGSQSAPLRHEVLVPQGQRACCCMPLAVLGASTGAFQTASACQWPLLLTGLLLPGVGLPVGHAHSAKNRRVVAAKQQATVWYFCQWCH